MCGFGKWRRRMGFGGWLVEIFEEKKIAALLVVLSIIVTERVGVVYAV